MSNKDKTIAALKGALDCYLIWIEDADYDSDNNLSIGSQENFGAYMSEHHNMMREWKEFIPQIQQSLEQQSQDADCDTCKGDPEACAEVPSLSHCEKASREQPQSVDVEGLKQILKDTFLIGEPKHDGQNDEELDRKSTRLNSSHSQQSRMPSSA